MPAAQSMATTWCRRLIFAALLLTVLAIAAHTRADPDLWGHVLFGRDIVHSRSIPQADSYSFTSDRTWINHEWLAEVVMYLSFAVAGGSGLVFLKIAALAATLWAVSSTVSHAPLKGWVLVVGIVLIGTVPQGSHVRPQLFSLALFAVLMMWLSRWRRDLAPSTARRGAWLFGLFALWANLHGGWIVGLGTVAIWVVVGAVQERSPERALEVALLLAACFSGSAATPYGWHLWEFLRETVGLNRFAITDWQPLMQMGPAYVGIWLLTWCATGFATYRLLRCPRPDWRPLAIAVALGIGAYQVNRLLGFFALATVPLFASLLEESTPQWFPPREMTMKGSRAQVAAATCITLLLSMGVTTSTVASLQCVRIDTTSIGFPEVGVAAVVGQLPPNSRLLVWFDWGEYAIWHFAPNVSVSIDGRRETVYSAATLSRQFDLYFSAERRQGAIDALRPDYIWLPTALATTAALRADGWTVVAEGERSVLLGAGAFTPMTPAVTLAGPRCFPGP